MRKWLFWFILAGVVVGMVSCDKQPAKTITLTDQDNGKTITLEAGQVLVIRLQSNPTTGYVWELGEVDAGVLKQVSEVFTPPPQATDQAGAGGVDEWRFQAVGTGTTTLVLNYRRPWEQGVTPAKTFTLTVTVKQ